MKLVIPGGTGQVGTLLARAFHKEGHEVVVLSRRPEVPGTPWRTVAWDAKSPGPWEAEIDGADVVINLAGRSVDCRYGAANRRSIMDSRVDSTHAVGRAIAKAAQPPRVWLQASTATIYAHRFDAPNDERTGIIGGGEPGAPTAWRFSIDVARAWERAVDEAGPLPQTRTVLLRSAMTMSPDRGGIFDRLLGLVRFGLGGSSGTGRQFVSWIHEEDFIRAVRFLIENEAISGPVNLAAPGPLPNADFMRELREAWGISFGLPAPAWLLGIGAVFLRTETELILKSRRVVPGVLLEHGFDFRFPAWPEAARDLSRRWRADWAYRNQARYRTSK
jgi:uncharacterized protein (TIGR01777 family)